MIEFKQKVQLGNRISIPFPIAKSLNIEPGDDVSIFCDEQNNIIYLQLTKPKTNIIFKRDTGTVITKEYHKPLTDTKFEPITQPPYTKITNQDKVLVEED